MGDHLKLVAGNGNPGLAAEISDYLDIPLCEAAIERFPDGETSAHIRETVRGEDVFVIQSTGPPANEHYMELFLMIDALRRASAKRVTVVMPYFGYARQDRKFIGRVPISAKLMANFLETAGADRVLTLDLPAGQIQGFFDIPVDNLRIDPIFAEYFAQVEYLDDDDTVIVAPDVGAAKRASAVSERLKVPYAIVEKARVSEQTGEAEARHIIGDVKNKRAVIVDDIIATGGTVVAATEMLVKCGAREVDAAFSHGIFAGDCLDKIARSSLKEVIVTNTVPVPKGDKITGLSVAKSFAETIIRIHEGRSVSELFPHY